MDTEYILDCAAEMGEVTPLEGMCLSRLTPAYDAVRALVDANQLFPAHFLENTARASFAEEDVEVQHWVALQTLQVFRECLDRVVGRANSVVQHKVQCALGLTEPSAFSELLGIDAQSSQLSITADSDVTEALVRQVLDNEFSRFKERLGFDVQAILDAVRWYRKDGGRRYEQMQRQRRQEPQSAPVFTIPQLARDAMRVKRSCRKRALAAIKKATKLFGRLGQSDNLRLMVSGHEITLEHEASPLKFLLRPSEVSGWLIERTVNPVSHTPYELSVWTKDNVFVSRLCVLMDHTPVLDQILALALFVKSGDELEILSKANWFGFGDEEGKAVVLEHYPALATKFPQKAKLPPGFVDDAYCLAPLTHWQPFSGRVRAWIETWMSPVVAPVLSLSLVQLAEPLEPAAQVTETAMQALAR